MSHVTTPFPHRRPLLGVVAAVASIATVLTALVSGAASVAAALVVGGLGLVCAATAEARRPRHVFAEDLDREVIVLRT